MAANKTVKPRKPKVIAPKVENIDTNLLTLNDLVSEDHLYDELVKVEFSDGRYTFVYKKFRPSKISEMWEQFSQYIQEYITKIGDLSESKAQDHILLHILLHFSKITPDLNLSFDEKVVLFGKILDSKLAETVFDAFDPEQVALVYERAEKMAEQTLNILNKNKEARNQVVEYVKNSNMANKDIILQTVLNVSPEDTGVDEADGEPTV